jgi:hypothetical protein
MVMDVVVRKQARLKSGDEQRFVYHRHIRLHRSVVVLDSLGVHVTQTIFIEGLHVLGLHT